MQLTRDLLMSKAPNVLVTISSDPAHPACVIEMPQHGFCTTLINLMPTIANIIYAQENNMSCGYLIKESIEKNVKDSDLYDSNFTVYTNESTFIELLSRPLKHISINLRTNTCDLSDLVLTTSLDELNIALEAWNNERDDGPEITANALLGNKINITNISFDIIYTLWSIIKDNINSYVTTDFIILATKGQIDNGYGLVFKN